MKFGLQLYSVKSFMQNSVKDTLKAVAEMGYTVVEPAGFFDTPAEDFKAWCDELGLATNSVHWGVNFLRDENIADSIAYLKTIGCKRFIIPGAPYSTKEDLDATIDLINKCEPILAKEGIELMYHNHSGEFVPNKDGIIAHLEMQKRTNIKFQIDVYWAYRAGLNPIYVLEQLKDRIAVVHLKDGTMEHGTPLGLGTTPIKEVVDWALANGVDMVVENEPDALVEMSEAKICADYLLSL